MSVNTTIPEKMHDLVRVQNQSVVMGLSGGLDSAVLLAAFLRYGAHKVYCCTFDYGSTHGPYERAAAMALLKHYDMPKVVHIDFDLRTVFKGFSSALLAEQKREIPEGRYSRENIVKTKVPGRNLIFASIMAGIAESVGAQYVALGIHGGDHDLYADCTPEFAKAVDSAVYQSSNRKVEVIAPLLRLHKAEIVRVGHELDVPFALTRSCYKPQPISCGKCATCVERRQAFDAAGIKDPIPYEDE